MTLAGWQVFLDNQRWMSNAGGVNWYQDTLEEWEWGPPDDGCTCGPGRGCRTRCARAAAHAAPVFRTRVKLVDIVELTRYRLTRYRLTRYRESPDATQRATERRTAQRAPHGTTTPSGTWGRRYSSRRVIWADDEIMVYIYGAFADFRIKNVAELAHTGSLSQA